MSIIYRRQIPLALTVIIVLIILAKTFTGNPAIKEVSVLIQRWGALATTISVGLGVVSIANYHIPRIMRKSNDPIKHQWVYSLSTMILMAIFMGVGLTFGNRSTEYQWLYSTWMGPISGLSSFISAFFSVTAVYRAFKIRSLDGAALIIPALLIFLYDAPLGLYLFPFLGPVGLYLFAVFDAGAFRAALLAVALGMVFILLRTITGQERGYMYEETA